MFGLSLKIREEFTCPLELVHDMIKGKWNSIILWRLRLGPTSLSKLEKDIDGITQKMLLEQLKELTDYGFVKKETFGGYGCISGNRRFCVDTLVSCKHNSF